MTATLTITSSFLPSLAMQDAVKQLSLPVLPPALLERAEREKDPVDG